MRGITLFLLLAALPVSTRTRSVGVMVRCPDPLTSVLMVVQRPETPEETDHPYPLKQGTYEFEMLFSGFLITSSSTASLRLSGARPMRTDCRHPVFSTDDVAHYTFDCGVEAKDLFITSDPPRLMTAYVRRFQGDVPEHDCVERGRLGLDHRIVDVSALEDLVLLVDPAIPNAPGLNVRLIRRPPGGKPTTLDRTQLLAELTRQHAAATGHLSPNELDYYGKALQNFNRLTIEPAPEPKK